MLCQVMAMLLTLQVFTNGTCDTCKTIFFYSKFFYTIFTLLATDVIDVAILIHSDTVNTRENCTVDCRY